MACLGTLVVWDQLHPSADISYYSELVERSPSTVAHFQRIYCKTSQHDFKLFLRPVLGSGFGLGKITPKSRRFSADMHAWDTSFTGPQLIHEGDVYEPCPAPSTKTCLRIGCREACSQTRMWASGDFDHEIMIEGDFPTANSIKCFIGNNISPNQRLSTRHGSSRSQWISFAPFNAPPRRRSLHRRPQHRGPDSRPLPSLWLLVLANILP